MILGKRKAVVVLAATAVMGVGAMWAPAAAQAAPVCVDVPGGTTGATVKVGPVEQRVPAVTQVRLCVQGPTAPSYRIETTGPNCLHNCYSVYAGGGTVGAGGIELTWYEDDAGKSAIYYPPDVALPGEQCLLSTGAPEAANPDCFIAVGVDQVPDVSRAVDDAITVVGSAIEDGVEITCANVPDMWDPNTGTYADFCTNPTAWTNAAVANGTVITCSSIPPARDDWGNEWRFCENPSQWLDAVLDDAHETCNWTLGYQWDPDRWEYVYFCDDPVRWTTLFVENFCGSLCDPPTVQELIAEIQRAASEIHIRIGRG